MVSKYSTVEFRVCEHKCGISTFMITHFDTIVSIFKTGSDKSG